MLISEILGNLNDFDVMQRPIDFVDIEWYDAKKRIARYDSRNGHEVAIRFNQVPKDGLSNGDIVFFDENQIIAIAIKPTDILRLCVHDSVQVAHICYEIGNYHIPLFFGSNYFEFMVPYEAPLKRLLDRLCIENWRENGVLDSKNRLQVHLPISEPQLKIAQDFQLTIH